MLRKVRLPMCNAQRKVGKGLLKAAMEINAGRSGDFAQDSTFAIHSRPCKIPRCPLSYELAVKALRFLINYLPCAFEPDLCGVLDSTLFVHPLGDRSHLVPSVLKVFLRC